MIYVALLRGINVGGNNKVEMAKLKESFISIGHTGVTTYINSGNIVFSSDKKLSELAGEIEAVIEKDFGFKVHVVVRDVKNIRAIEKATPQSWVNDGETMKTDVLSLWEDVDSEDVLNELVIKPGIDEVQYVPGAIIWRVDRKNVSKSGLMKIIGTPLYKKVTIRNINTVRKLTTLMTL